MSDAQSLLIELGVEELPVHSVDALAEAFAQGVCEGLTKRGIAADVANARTYAAPRRLAVWVPGVAAMQPDQQHESFGPYAKIALDAAGQPTKALLGFAHKFGVEWSALAQTRDTKGERFAYRSVTPGQATAALIPAVVQAAAAQLPIPKPMRWGDHDFAFVRPLHWLVMLYGNEIVEGELFGIASGRQSRGHRFLHPAPVHLVDADGYVDAMRAAKVLVDPGERRQKIRTEVARVTPAGSQPHLDDALLEELANLNAWPVAIACTFDRDFLAVPHEALVTTMRANQKFVPVFDAAGELSEHFIGIANIESKDPAQIRHGYERVIRPRFADAKFFFDEDRKTPLGEHCQALRNVTYQKKLGSLWDKTERVAELAGLVASRLATRGRQVNAAALRRAAELSRCDLLTRMVGEFPELQGIAGRHYAAAQGEPAEVAVALDSFYAPRQSGDVIAADALGQALAIADRSDTLAGIFAVGGKPTGNKDPFALRRAALGLARTLVEAKLDLDLVELIERAVVLVERHLAKRSTRVTTLLEASWLGDARTVHPETEALYQFVLDRLRGYCSEAGFTTQQFEAVAAVRPASLTDFDRRLRAVAAFALQPEAEKLAAANKRVANILRKQAVDVAAAAQHELDAALLREPAEQALAEALEAARKDNASRLEGAAEGRDYAGALLRLAELQAPIDAFFEGVMVMADDPALRANRVALLARIKARFDVVADIALL